MARVAVVGGGVVGLASACFLAERHDVVVLEARAALGSGSSGRNPGAIRTAFGSPLNAELTKRSVELFPEVEDRSRTMIGFGRRGYLWLGSTEGQERGLRAAGDQARDVGSRASWLTAEEIASRYEAIRPDRLRGGLLLQDDGVVDPSALVAALAGWARSAGVEILAGRRATRLERQGEATSGLSTTGGVIGADAVVLAAGADTNDLLASARVALPLTPYRRHSFVSGPAAWAPVDLPFTVDAATGAYFRVLGSSVMFGKGREYEEDRPTDSTDVAPGALDRAYRAAIEVVPAMAETVVRYGIAGTYVMTPDLHAVLGPVGAVPGLYVATGFSGHGLMQAVAAGRLVAEWIDEGSPVTVPDAHRLRPGRFQDGEQLEETLQI